MAKKLVKLDDQVQLLLTVIIFVQEKHLFFLIWQSLESLPVYVSCNSVLLELSSIRLRFSFFM